MHLKKFIALLVAPTSVIVLTTAHSWVPVLIQIHLVRILTSYSFRIHFNIISPDLMNRIHFLLFYIYIVLLMFYLEGIS